MNTYKNQLIDNYILPLFIEEEVNHEKLREDLYTFYKLNKVVAHQLLELPGSVDDGKMWFSISSTVHSYYLSSNNRKQRGRQIWRKLNFILDCESLLDRTWRTDYLQALEQGDFLSIQFSDLVILMERYHSVKSKIEQLAKMQREYNREHNQLLLEMPEKRIEELVKSNPVFMACSNQETQAMHTHMSVRCYRDHLRNIKRRDFR